MGFFSNIITKSYGWDIELTCGQCGATAMPRYEGWSPSLKTNLGPNVRVYAKVACPKCGRRLTGEAGKKLVGLFGDLDLCKRNGKIITQFIARLFLVPAVLAFVLFFGMKMDWWDWGLGTLWVLLVSAVSIPVLVRLKNKDIELLSCTCECGKPHYICMGSLENNNCYRCYSCGRLLKVRE